MISVLPSPNGRDSVDELVVSTAVGVAPLTGSLVAPGY
jgi:hypothetical protein